MQLGVGLGALQVGGDLVQGLGGMVGRECVGRMARGVGWGRGGCYNMLVSLLIIWPASIMARVMAHRLAGNW